MQGTLERSDGAGNGRNHIGVRGDDHPRRKGGSVEPVIAYGIEIGFQRAGPFGRRLGAGQLVQVMGRVRKIGAHRNRRRAAPHPPVCSDDGGEGRDGGQRVVQGVFLAVEAEQRRRHPQHVHGRRLCGGCFAQDVQAGAWQRPPTGEILREPHELRGFRQPAMQQQVGHFFEPGMRGQVFHGVPRDRQPARLSIDVAESS